LTDDARALDYLTGRVTGGARPAAVGRKFAAGGAVLPTRGNTFLAHVDRASPAHAALTRAQAHLAAGPQADAFAFLPPASFHMTVFQGVIETERRADRWPGHLPLDARIDDVTADFRHRIAGLALPGAFDIRVRGVFAGFSVAVEGAGADAEAALRDARDALSERLNLRVPDHATYAFHITLGYLLRWLAPAEAQAAVARSHEAAADLPETIRLGPVEFCAFEDMTRFDPLPPLAR
jgi:hypothetical protein